MLHRVGEALAGRGICPCHDDRDVMQGPVRETCVESCGIDIRPDHRGIGGVALHTMHGGRSQAFLDWIVEIVLLRAIKSLDAAMGAAARASFPNVAAPDAASGRRIGWHVPRRCR